MLSLSLLIIFLLQFFRSVDLNKLSDSHIQNQPRNGEFCYSLLANHTVSHKDCRPVIIQNRICFGACNSLTVPGQHGILITSCRNCWFDRHERIKIKLKCPRRKRKYKWKDVIIVKSCKCQDMNKCQR